MALLFPPTPPLCPPTQELGRLGRPLEHSHCWVPQFKADPVTLRSLLSGTAENITVMHRPHLFTCERV